MPSYKLTYFPITALAEPIRFLLSYAGIDFEDDRFNREDWPKIKETMPFGQVPVLEVDGKKINQSMAISRYLAKKCGLAGKDDWEALEIDATVDTINDLRQKIGIYSYESHEEAKAAKHKIVKEQVQYYLERLDAQVQKNGGYFIGGSLSWADLVFVGLLDYMNHMMDNQEIIEKYDNLKQLNQKVLEVPAIKSWIEKRPQVTWYPARHCAVRRRAEWSSLSIASERNGQNIETSPEERRASGCEGLYIEPCQGLVKLFVETASGEELDRTVRDRPEAVSRKNEKMPTYKLTYFNLTALGEPIRYMLHYCDIPFEDIRIEIDDWLKHKADMPLGQVPILEIDGKVYHQSRAISRYLAKKNNLYSSDEFEAMEIDAMVDSIDDLRHAVATFYWNKDPVFKEKLKEIAFEKLPFYLDKFEEQVKKNDGHFVRGKLSWADFVFAAYSGYLNVLLGEDMNKDHPELKKLVEKVNALPNVKAYLEKRPKTMA
ncbi:PREDICTED: uncharacterized protein LOC106743045 [Dinoponera quadriceps]|uniref:glutathione transferase n=1 Tax=Dinoponera quadriceps TaxID=609295 RepID=A0A6P3X2D6_DINQU|nr:PREDICTED: uncharacterized protein LOC106743045 [Dinoponera quadriceps]